MLDKPDPGAIAAGLATAATAPLLGDYALIVIGAIFGGYIAVSRMTLGGHWESAKVMVRYVLIGVLPTAVVVAALAPKLAPHGIGADLLFMPVAGLIAAAGDRWGEIGSAMLRIVAQLIPEALAAWLRAILRIPKP